jgi:hypothetical protein
MGLVSVVPPVFRPVPDHLLSAYASRAAPRGCLRGWDWEGIVQEDGASEIAATILPRDARIRMGPLCRLGVAHTRNLALAQ